MKKVALPDYEGVDPQPKPAPRRPAPAPGPVFESKRPAVILSASLPRAERDPQAASDFERLTGFSPDVPEIVGAFVLPALSGSALLAAATLRAEELRARRAQLASSVAPADPILRDVVGFVSEYCARFSAFAAALDPRADHPRLTPSYSQLVGAAIVPESAASFVERIGVCSPGAFVSGSTATKAYDSLLRAVYASVEPGQRPSEIAALGDRVAAFENQRTGSIVLDCARDVAIDDVLNVPPERYAQLRARLTRAFYDIGSSLQSSDVDADLACCFSRELALSSVDASLYGEFSQNPAIGSPAPLQRFKLFGTGVLSLEDAYVDSYQPGQRWFAATVMSRDRAQFDTADLRSFVSDVAAAEAAARILVEAASTLTGSTSLNGERVLRECNTALAPHAASAFVAVLARSAVDAALRSAVGTLIASRLTRVVNSNRPFALAGDPARVTPLSEVALRSVEAALSNIGGTRRSGRRVTLVELRSSLYSAAGPLQAAAAFVASLLSYAALKSKNSLTLHSKLSTGSVFCIAVELLARAAALLTTNSVSSADSDSFELLAKQQVDLSYAASRRRDAAAAHATHVLHSYFVVLSAEASSLIAFLRSARALISVQRLAAAAGAAARYALQPTQLPLLASALADYELRTRTEAEPDPRFVAADDVDLVRNALATDTDRVVIGLGLPLGFRDFFGERISSASSRGRRRSLRRVAVSVNVKDDLAPNVVYRPIEFEWDLGVHPVRVKGNTDPAAFVVRDESSVDRSVSVSDEIVSASRAVELLASLVVGAEIDELSWYIDPATARLVASQTEFEAALPADQKFASTDLEKAAAGVYVDRAKLAAGVLSARVSPLRVSSAILSPRKFDRVLWFAVDRASETRDGVKRVPLLARYACRVEAI